MSHGELTPNTGYDVARQPSGGGVQITVRPGSGAKSDEGGVLVF